MTARPLLPVATSRESARLLRPFLRGRRLRLFGALALFLCHAGAALLIPLLIGRIVDLIGSDSGAESPAVMVWWLAGVLMAAGVGAGLCDWLARRTLAQAAEPVVAELREDFFARVLGLPRHRVENAGIGDLVTRASDDIARISEVLPEVLPRIAVAVFTMMLAAGGLLMLDWRFLVAFALLLPLYGATLLWYLQAAPPVFTSERQAQSERGREVMETLQALPAVRAHRLEGARISRIRPAAWEVGRWAIRTRIMINRLFGRLNSIEFLGLFLTLAAGLWAAHDAVATVGSVTAAALLLLRTTAPFNALLLVISDLQEGTSALARVLGIAGDESSASSASSAQQGAGGAAFSGPPALRMEDVSFGYHRQQLALDSVDLQVGRREHLAVVGASGSGKSTLAGILAGSLGSAEGRAGRISRSISICQTVTITQEVHVFPGTLQENLTLAAPGARAEQVTAALRALGAERLVGELPEAMETILGASGYQLSGVQAQLMALVRAELADPELVILDEATAEAGADDAASLDRAASRLTEGRTAVVVAHRLEQAKTCDRIVVLQGGRIVEEGTHRQLLEQHGRYARLWQAHN